MAKMATFVHMIDPLVLRQGIDRLVGILDANAYDRSGMDFGDVVARKLVDDCVSRVGGAGARVKNHNWEFTRDGGISVKLFLMHEEDLVLLKEIFGRESDTARAGLVARSAIGRPSTDQTGGSHEL